MSTVLVLHSSPRWRGARLAFHTEQLPTMIIEPEPQARSLTQLARGRLPGYRGFRVRTCRSCLVNLGLKARPGHVPIMHANLMQWPDTATDRDQLDPHLYMSGPNQKSEDACAHAPGHTVRTPAVLAPQAVYWSALRSAANSMHCRSTQDIASPDEEWVEGVHAATQAAQEDLLISNTRLIGSGQGAYDASRMSTVRQLRMLVSLKVMNHHRSACCMQHMQLQNLAAVKLDGCIPLPAPHASVHGIPDQQRL